MEYLGKAADDRTCRETNRSDRLTRVYSQIDKSPEKSIEHSRRKRGSISVCLARTEQELFQAYRIAQEQYIDSGYTDRTSGDIRFLPHYALPASYTFIAYENVFRPVGTVTLVLDRKPLRVHNAGIRARCVSIHCGHRATTSVRHKSVCVCRALSLVSFHATWLIHETLKEMRQ